MLAVRAFEAAAREGGFTKAAQELCVSPGAVAHQVKQLEDWLRTQLFLRKPRSVELTDAGRAYWASVNSVLDDLERASVDVRRWSAEEGVVTITAMPSFVTRWLMPRLGTFLREHPELDVRVLASVPPADFGRDRVDLAIRLGAGSYPGLLATPILAERFRPVASPAYLQLAGTPSTPSAFTKLVLLHDEYEARIPQQVDWARWFQAAGVVVPQRRLLGGLHFSHSYLTIDAAIAGQGIAMQSHVLVQDSLATKRLASASEFAVKGPYRYSLLRTRAAEKRLAVKRLADWLIEEARNFEREAV
jgi:LysR family glycine cleavage system transcriptional activator